MDAHWAEDPVFDAATEVVGDVTVRGEAWRRLHRLREDSGRVGVVVRVAGPTHYVPAVRRARERGGDDVRIVPDPTNAEDANAKRVLVAGEHVGHVPRGYALPPGPVHLLALDTRPVPHCWLFVAA